jgi:chromosome segregation protein
VAIHDRIQSLSQQIQSNAEGVSVKRAHLESLRAEEQSLALQLQLLEQKVSTESKECRVIEERYQSVQESIQHMAYRLESILDQRRETKKQVELFQARFHEEQSSQKVLQEEITEWNRTLEGLQNHLVESKAVHLEQSKQLQALRNESQRLNAVLDEGSQRVRQLQGQHNHAQVQLQALKEAIDTLESDYMQRFFEPLHELAAQMELSIGVAAAERELKMLRQELDNAKDVNLASIDELERVGERHRFLIQQLGDVTESEKALQKELHSLEVASKKLFGDAFEAIRVHFQRNFATLFEGGHADLRLTEGEDPLESGVEIVAQPPGKQMRLLQLLSGGERSLTAIALLFAMFEIKPAPFCLLDEMDAALDDANVTRFTKLLGHYLNRTQFLLITHNKHTMAAADLLFGVSMQEKGVSTVLSLDFVESEAPQLAMVGQERE